MSAKLAGRLTWFILGLGAVMTACVYALHGRFAGQSAAAGVGLAVGNWLLLRFVLARIVSSTSTVGKTGFSVLLMLKMGALMAIVFVLLHLGLVEPMAFTVGVSSLVFGSLVGSAVHAIRSPAEGKS